MEKQKGFSLIEVSVALLLVGILGAAVPSALSSTFRATTSTNKNIMAESLARSQMDHIQNQPYDSCNSTPVYTLLSDLPDSYSIVTPVAARLDPKGDGLDSDDGLQKITVAVKHGGDIVFTLIDYKVNFSP
jgi:prepilin-type N-terminal cleavage/methylation domain-containing protein